MRRRLWWPQTRGSAGATRGSRRARLHFCLSRVGGSELQPSWHCRTVGGCSRQQTCIWELPEPLWLLKECAHSRSHSPPCAREVCVCYIPRDAGTVLTCVSAQAEPQNPLVQPQDTHTKALEAKGPINWVETINIFADFLQERYSTKTFRTKEESQWLRSFKFQ